MHFHYFALRRLASYLSDELQGEVVVSCFSQNKNELILETSALTLRIGCATPHTYVVPVADFSKARRNVADLFPEILGLHITGAYSIDWERVMVLNLENGYDLILKMHGIRANVLLRKDEEVVALFTQKVEEDLSYVLKPGLYEPHLLPETCSANEQEVLKALRQVSAVYEKNIARRVCTRMQEGLSLRAAFDEVNAACDSGEYYLVKEPTQMRMLLFPPPADLPSVQVSGIAPALLLLIRTLYPFDSYRRMYKSCEDEVKKPLDKLRKLVDSQLHSILHIEEERSPEEIGHLLMAQLHLIENEARTIDLEDYYIGGTLTVKLDPRLSPQQNATRYYEKHKDRKLRLQYLQEQLADTEQKLQEAQVLADAFAEVPTPESLVHGPQGFAQASLTPLRDFAKSLSKASAESDKERPYRLYFLDGFEIMVGRNARSNDELSFHVAAKNDLWLHAKDVTGSHVVIRSKGGQGVPDHVLEYAAGLAAYFSKRRSEAYVPVSYTSRKYIRKRKGDPPGMVVVDREEVILVAPVKE
ncbi:MAG: DUF814 domain-containing protein [Bacteroidetes bacterium]|nr:MAG: DUF814 domain-containing protein [Bacteroidota bacterium]